MSTRTQVPRDTKAQVPMLSLAWCTRAVLVLGASAFLGLWLIGWLEPIDLQLLSLRWKSSSASVPKWLQDNNMSSGEFVLQRGIRLLHSWSDDELFQRAMVKEKSNNFSSSSSRPKIAFMFLTRGKLEFAPLWKKFFDGNEELYNIYVHMDPLRLSEYPRSVGVFWGRFVPSEPAQRLTPGMIAAGRRFLANALLDDPDNKWFAVISESCIPLHSFQHIYKVVTSSEKTFMEMREDHPSLWSRYIARGTEAMKPEIEFSQFRIASQFWIMMRHHALMVVSDTKYWNKFNRPCLPENWMCFPEEHYFPTLLNILDSNGTTGYPVTWVDWSVMEAGGHPRKFLASEISRKFIRDLQNLENGRFLFARKFEPACLQPILRIADVILKN